MKFSKIVDKVTQKTHPEKEVKQESNSKNNETKLSIRERRPNGLSLEELKTIDYSEVGNIFKKTLIFPKSVDPTPISIDFIKVNDNIPVLMLSFKSKTSSKPTVVRIRKYCVELQFAIANIYEPCYSMSKAWEKFIDEFVSKYEQENCEGLVK